MEQNWEPRNKFLYLWSLDFSTRCQDKSMEKNSFFNKQLGQLDLHLEKDETVVLSYTKINSKWIINLSIGPKTKTLLEKSLNLHNLSLGNNFLYMIPKAKPTKKKKISWISSKIKTFMFQRALSGKWKDNPLNGKKYFQSMYLIREL